LRPAEREQQLDFIRRKFLQEFNLEPVAVLGAAPLLVVLSSSKSLEDKQELATFGRRGEGLVQQFKETEQNLRVVLKKGRDRLIQERIRSLLQLLLSSLGKNLSSLKESNIGALNNSKSQRPQDLADFTKCQQEKYMQHFSREIHKVLDQILSFWTHQIKDIQDEIKQGIQTAPNLVVLGTFARENPTKMRLMKLSSALHNLFSEILRASTNLCERLFESYRSDLIITYPEIQVKDHPQRMQILKLQVTQECITKEIMRAFNSLGVFGRGIGTSFLTNWFTGHTLVSKRSEAYRIGSECVVAIRVHWEKDLKLYTIQLGQQLGSELERLSIFYQRSISREVIRIQAKHGAIENLLEDNLARLQTDLAWIEHQTAPGKLPPPLTN
jgi:hypothetical protein